MWTQPAFQPRQWRSASCDPTSISIVIISTTVPDTGTTTDTSVTTTTTTTAIHGVSDTRGLLLAAGRGGRLRGGGTHLLQRKLRDGMRAGGGAAARRGRAPCRAGWAVGLGARWA